MYFMCVICYILKNKLEKRNGIKKTITENTLGGAWLAHSVQCMSLDREVVGSSPTFGVEIT